MTSIKRQAAYGRGVAAERQAASYLERQGFRIAEQRYKTRHGEIDLIARQERLTIFVEVKARRHGREALESISTRQRQRIIAAALEYLAEHDCSDHDLRFDVITVNAAGALEHLENAWEVEEIY